jgi:hypothetical protein
MPRNGCLRVLDPARGDREIYDGLAEVLTAAIPLSDPSRIVIDTENPAVPMFFSEPAHEWCYYFTKAGLAQQQGDYEQVVALGNEAMSLGFNPQDQNEWLVFIDAYARTGDFKTAEKLSKTALAEEARSRGGVCNVWEQIQAQSPVGGEGQIEEIIRQIRCNP